MENAELYKFLIAKRILGKMESIVLDQKSIAQAHRYVLLHSDIISDYRRLVYLKYYLKFFIKSHLERKLIISTKCTKTQS